MGNSFENLWEEEEQRFTLPPNTKGISDFQLIQMRIEQQQHSTRFNGDVAELFLPRMIRAVIGMFGGEVATNTDNDAVFDRPAPSDVQWRRVSKPKSPSIY